MNEQAHVTVPSPDAVLPKSTSQRSLQDYWNDGWAVLGARWHLRAVTNLGPRVRLWGKAVVKNYGTMTIAERVRLVATIVPLEFYVGTNATLEIGAGAYINYGCSIAASQSVRIGPNCNIGTYAIIMDNDFHRIEPERRTELQNLHRLFLKRMFG